jgi:hypothetical protein
MPPPGVIPARGPALRGFLWGTGVMVSVGLVLFSAAQAAKSRAEGDSLTGAAAAMATPGAGAANVPDPDEAAAKAVLTHDPENLEARLELARVSLDKQDFMAAWNETQRVLTRVPGEPRALTYQSQVRLAMGQPDVALSMLKEALAKDAGFLQAHIYLSYVHLRLGQTREAEAAIAEAKRRFPAEAATLDRGFSDMRASVEKEGPMALAGAGNPHAALGASAAGGAANPHAGLSSQAAPNPHADLSAEAAPNPHAHGERRVAGILDLDPALTGHLAPGSVVFLTVREAGFGAGPPIAAKRLPASTFPLSFEISSADSMQGDTIPGEMLLEARLDADGDPFTKELSDPRARLDDVKAGTTHVRLVLKRR